MTDDKPELCLATELAKWEVILDSGERIEVLAHAFARERGHHIFSVLLRGRPNVELEVVRIPSSIVATVAGG